MNDLVLIKRFSISLLVTALILCQLPPSHQAFLSPLSPAKIGRSSELAQSPLRPVTHLGIFGESGIFGSLFGNSGGASGQKTVLEIPASTVKIGALRFLLQIFLVSEQNRPVKGAWTSRQGDEGQLQVYYQDGTGMFSVDLKEYSIKVTRFGERPSLQYMLQESVLLHGLLDELQTVALDVEDIEEDKRLLQLKDVTAIEKARGALPARQEK